MIIVNFNHPVPLKAIPIKSLDHFLATEFKYWVSTTLNLSADKNDTVNEALQGVKAHFWNYGLKEIRKIFEMYFDNKLGIEPIPGYFDRVLIGKISEAYKRQKPKKTIPIEVHISKEDRERYAYLNCIISFDNYKQEHIMDKSDWCVYDELDKRKLLDFTKKEKLEAMEIVKEKYEKDFVERAKALLLERFYNNLITKGKHIKELL